MGAKQKLETLTNSWYGFSLAGAVLGLFLQGFSIWKLFTTVVGLMFSFAWIWFLGNRLQNKSGLTRWLLILFSGFMTAGAAVSAAKMSWAFVHVWELRLIASAAVSVVYGWMMAKSFRTLTDSSVKIYFSN